MAIHEAFEGVGAIVLTLGGLAFVVGSVRQARAQGGPTFQVGLRPDPSDASVRDLMWVAVATASAGAAVVHFALAPEHLGELGALGLGFALAGGLQAISALVALRWRSRSIALPILVLNVGLIAVWAWSRLIGLPVGDQPWTPEPIGRADLVTVALEGLIVIVLVLLLADRRIHALAKRSPFAAFGLVPVVGSVAVLTILALSGGRVGHG